MFIDLKEGTHDPTKKMINIPTRSRAYNKLKLAKFRKLSHDFFFHKTMLFEEN